MPAYAFVRRTQLPRWCVSSLFFVGAAIVGHAQSPLPSSRPPSPESSLVILPVRLAGKPATRVSEVVAFLLEKKGLKNIDLAAQPFEPTGAMESWSQSLRDYLCAHPVTSDFVLYAAFDGTRETGLNDLHAILADRAGGIVWSSRRTPADATFRRVDAREPMTMAVLLAEELAPQFGLDESTAKAAHPGKFAQVMEQRSGLPPADERSALLLRQRNLALKRARVTVEVYPVRIGAAVDSESASLLARKLCAADIGETCSIAQPLMLKASPPDPNEQRALWDLAREFRSYLRKYPSAADYAVYAHYNLDPRDWERGAVHFVVCASRGDWVIVDFQNSHHPDYRNIRPATKEDCAELVVLRIASYLAAALPEPSSSAPPTDGTAASMVSLSRP